jgi:hypothetical protein
MNVVEPGAVVLGNRRKSQELIRSRTGQYGHHSLFLLKPRSMADAQISPSLNVWLRSL